MKSTHSARLKRAIESLEGLSVGDAFGQLFFRQPVMQEASLKGHWVETAKLPPAWWPWTDDTALAIAIVDVLKEHEGIDQDALAQTFGKRYRAEPNRGYGPAMHDLLTKYKEGPEWRKYAHRLFDGSGSFGNGSAMRVTPVGAYYADDLEACAEAARQTAEITHTNEEASAGAIAVAVATGLAYRYRDQAKPARGDFIEELIAYVPSCEVRRGLTRVLDFRERVRTKTVARTVGNGSKITCMDTVPFVIYCASEFLDDYETALWETASALGDVDTTCAMVGGIVVGYCGMDSIPTAWHVNREELPKVVV